MSLTFVRLNGQLTYCSWQNDMFLVGVRPVSAAHPLCFASANQSSSRKAPIASSNAAARDKGITLWHAATPLASELGHWESLGEDMWLVKSNRSFDHICPVPLCSSPVNAESPFLHVPAAPLCFCLHFIVTSLEKPTSEKCPPVPTNNASSGTLSCHYLWGRYRGPYARECAGGTS